MRRWAASVAGWTAAMAVAPWLAAPAGAEPPPAGVEAAPEPGDDEVDRERLNPIVVTGSRAERRWSEEPVATEVIDADTIRASGAERLTDLLEEQPGVMIRRSFGTAGVELQGLDPAYSLILIDGQRVGGRVGGIVDLNRFGMEQIERVEIVRGAASAIYGSEAIGGVVNIITRRPTEPLEGRVRASYGTFDTIDASGVIGLARGGWNARASVGYHASDGFDLNPESDSTTGPAFDQIQGSARAEYELSPGTDVSLEVEYLRRDQAAVDAMATGAIFDRKNRTETFGVRLAPRFSLGGLSTGRAWAGYSLFRDQFLLDQRGSAALDQRQLTLEHLVQGGAQFDLGFGTSHVLSVGVEGLYEQLQSERLESGQGDRGRVAP